MQPQSTTSKRLGRPTGPRVERTCPQCGKVDLLPPYKLRNPYCSKACSNSSRLIDPITRFWDLVDTSDPDGCWPWIAARDKDGYGLFTIQAGKQQVAHRFLLNLFDGPLTDDERALHHCDNPPCCRPDHLFKGTNADNMADMVAKGRSLTGERHPRAKLTENDVREIRQRYRPGVVTARALAHEFGIERDTVYDIVTYRSWQNIS
jgi:hypothetical protein